MKEVIRLYHETPDGETEEFGCKLRPLTPRLRMQYMELNQKHIDEAEQWDAASKRLLARAAQAQTAINNAQTAIDNARNLLADPGLLTKEGAASPSQLQKEIKNAEKAIADADRIYEEIKQEQAVRNLASVGVGTKYNVGYLKLILDMRGVTPEHKALLNSEYDSEFWMSQPDEEVASAISRFRG